MTATSHLNQQPSFIKKNYEINDRGNVIQFYKNGTSKIVGEINREATVNGKPDQETWIGSSEVKEWAINNGYPEVSDMPISNEFVAEASARTRILGSIQ